MSQTEGTGERRSRYPKRLRLGGLHPVRSVREDILYMSPPTGRRRRGDVRRMITWVCVFILLLALACLGGLFLHTQLTR